ncbi:MAG: S9 family peptidase [Alcanivoracaceae bacterium]|nr:S9 family peptidase [Alcanivoracaceae bacterium]
MKNTLKLYMVLTILMLHFSMQASATLMEQILEDTKYINLEISPDGNHFAMTYKDGDKINMSIFDISTTPMKVTSGVSLGGDLSVWDIYWANNHRVIYSVLISRSWYNEYKSTGEMFGIDIDGSNHDVIFGQRAANNNRTGAAAAASRIKGAESELATFEMIDLLPNDDNFVLIKSTPFNAKDSVPTVYKLNINNGKKKKITTLPLPRSNAITDINGHLRYANGIDKNGKSKLYKWEDQKWNIALEYYGNKGGATPIAISDEYIYMTDDADNELDGLYRINITDNKRELLYRHEFTDISQIYINPNTQHPYLVVTDPAKEEYHYFEESGNLATTHKKLTRAFKGSMVHIISFTEDLNKMIVRVSSDKVFGEFYLFDRVTQNAAFIASQKPKLKSSQLASMQPISYENRDGKTIRGFFTKATGLADDKTAPLVVMPHGGPQDRDYWQFDSQVQVLATNGFSVLQINFTGSSGYGKDFRYGSNKQWGDLVQDDITDGTNWAIENGLVARDKVCIYGFSFGGYSALMSVIRQPDLYQCAAGGGGVYDLGLMYKAEDINQLLWGKEYLQGAIGEDEQELKRNSPTYNTDKIKVPVFIAHGKNDTRVPPKQAKKLVKMLKKSGVPHEVAYYAKEGHGFADLDNRIKFNQQLLKFLKKHLSK